MSDEKTTEPAEPTEPTAEPEAPEQDPQEPAEQPADDDKPLGAAGEKALQAEKEKRKKAAAELREAKAELERLRNGDDKVAEAAREAERAAIAKANSRILRAEIKAAAAGRLANPALAVKLLDLDQFEVSEDGDVDPDEIASAIGKLLKDEPYLAAQGGKSRFQGTGDGGSRKGNGRPSQLSREDLKRMSPEAIVKAKAEGRLNEALGINR
ncbi:hypothetical protein [Actinomadura sp. 21ATH]|uniref:hypothetical protein n=1 Tax=Actinomadura sp. 21ATH TaxID=1735444 RepID=UPI0035C0EC9E